jgi:hypothetical protein
MITAAERESNSTGDANPRVVRHVVIKPLSAPIYGDIMESRCQDSPNKKATRFLDGAKLE